MELEQEKINIIKTSIKTNVHYLGNEDLYDQFYEEIFKRVFIVMDIANFDDALNSYLEKITNMSMLRVLNKNNRMRKRRNAQVQVDDDNNNLYNDVKISYENFVMEDTPCEIVIQEKVLSQVLELVYKINDKYPEERYIQLYKSRYIDGKTQREIAESLGLSQMEVANRFFKLMQEIKNNF